MKINNETMYEEYRENPLQGFTDTLSHGIEKLSELQDRVNKFDLVTQQELQDAIKLLEDYGFKVILEDVK